MPLRNRQWLLARRPGGVAEEADFRLVEAEVPALAKGQLLVRVHYLSLDPYMRGRMDDVASYAPPQPLGQVMIGATVGEVVDSRHPGFQPGESVVCTGGWQQPGRLARGRQRYPRHREAGRHRRHARAQ